MATLFVAAAGQTPTWIGIAYEPERELSALAKRTRGKVKIRWEYKATRDAADYIERVLHHRLIVEGATQDSGGWWIGLTTSEVIDIARETVRLFERGPPLEPASDIMRSLRVGTFQVSMSTFADLAGVSTSQVSRWESGDQIPDYRSLSRLRLHAIIAGLEWPKNFPITLSDARSGSSNVVPFRRARETANAQEAKSKSQRR